MRYHTILFDADNTLLDFFKSEKEALRDALGFLGVLSNEEMLKKYSEINDGVWKMLERGEITKAELRELRFALFSSHFSLGIDVPRLANLYTELLATKSFLMDGALEVCRRLAEHCRLYVITNGMASVQHGRFDSSPLHPLFEGAFISDEIGAEKPSPLFFAHVAANIPQFDPRDTLVVGDSLTSDIKGGVDAGIDTCWFNPGGKPVPDGMPIKHVITRLEELVPLVVCE